MTLTNATTAEALAAWKSGESVFTCEMGGMGPGYEQCIQIMGFAFLDAMESDPFDWVKYDSESVDEKRQIWRAYSDKIEATAAQTVQSLGPSGAQFGAAMGLASRIHKIGYAAAMADVPQDRLIQVSKNFPVAA